MKTLTIVIKEKNGSHKTRIDEYTGNVYEIVCHLLSKHGRGIDKFVAKHQLEFREDVKRLEA
jgi:hypothetical protein